MAEDSISGSDQEKFSCPLCLDLLKDPVTLHCGHNFCMVCINGHWDQEDLRGVNSCPQCSKNFTPRPVLNRNNMLAEVIKLKQKSASPAHPENLPWKNHTLDSASTRLQENICSQHNEPIETYCRTDEKFLCYLCTLKEHHDHDTVAAAAERTERENQLKGIKTKSQLRIQEKQKKLQELNQAVNTLKRAAEELLEQLEQLEQEISDLKRRHTDLEELSDTEDHIHFLKSFQSLCVTSGSENSPNIRVRQHLSFDEVIRSVSDLKKQLEELCEEKFSTMSPHAAAVQVLSSELKTREDFLQYFCQLSLDPNTAYVHLVLSEKNRTVEYVQNVQQQYPDHPERFDNFFEVLSKESVIGRCYWEVEWSSKKWVFISVSYKGISRKGSSDECKFGGNHQSWSLQTSSPLSFWHNNTETKISSPPSSRIGVYVDHSAGTLSFYSVSDTMTLLHTVHTTFTQPLHAGFWLAGTGSKAVLCNATPNISSP